ncbi:hypothetical protein P261_00341 [Lachnospiraceae bacterium TWA4]|nr:hypothetical protein P261_00341 [Lachnospiraceae bacterium TWA4]
MLPQDDDEIDDDFEEEIKKLRIEIEDGITEIKEFAFENCPLIGSIIIPKTVVKIS